MRPIVRVLGEALHLDFDDEFIECRLDRWHESGGDTTAEVTVLTTAPGVPPHVQQAKLNLTSHRARQDFAKRCARRFGGVDWDDLIERACVEALAVRRQGEPVVRLADVPAEAAPVYRVAGWVPDDGATILYGDGGVGKSTLALAVAASVALGEPFMGLPTLKGRPLYLDYETSARQQARRLRLLAQGMEWTPAPDVLYKNLNVPMPDLGPELRRLCDVEGVGMVILDSLAYAGGGQPEADPTLAVFRVLNSLRRPVLALAHVPKSDSGKPYGSAFVWNAARSVIEVKKQQEAGETSLTVGMFHRKANDDKLQHPLGVSIRFLPDATILSRADLGGIPGLAEHLPLSSRVEDTLRAGAQAIASVAQTVEKPENTVRAILSRLHARGRVVRLPDGRWGLPASAAGAQQ
jgi:hypothetical protein